MFGVKDPIPGGLRSRVVYKYACAGCNAFYVGEMARHFSTPVRELLVSDRASHVFKHLQNSKRCRASCSVDCFHILDHAPTSFQLKIKEAIHIQREQPSLNQQLHHVNLSYPYNFHIVTFSVVTSIISMHFFLLINSTYNAL